MRPTVQAETREMYECYDCGARSTDVDVRWCPECGAPCRNIGSARDY